RHVPEIATTRAGSHDDLIWPACYMRRKCGENDGLRMKNCKNLDLWSKLSTAIQNKLLFL
ncbi:hypothetical protein, partial [Hallella multisaccharivorax]|uniref:hypothetical protein n=1 Tax=Hallella multisaccharivorax TaxID=310514 RepID=UPI00360ACEC0